MPMTDNQTKLLVFRSLCRHNCDFMYGWVPLPTTVIANILGISLYRCRKAMKQLVAEGLATRTSCILSQEEPLPYNGFAVTEAGKQKGIYMYVALQSARTCAACFDASVASFLPSGFDARWLSRGEKLREANDMLNIDTPRNLL